jgi:hypothetical protein
LFFHVFVCFAETTLWRTPLTGSSISDFSTVNVVFSPSSQTVYFVSGAIYFAISTGLCSDSSFVLSFSVFF